MLFFVLIITRERTLSISRQTVVLVSANRIIQSIYIYVDYSVNAQ